MRHQHVRALVGHQDILLSTIKRRTLSRFGHVCRHVTLLKTTLHETVDGGRRSGRLCTSWKDNINEWTDQSLSSLLRIADDRIRLAAIAADISLTTLGSHGNLVSVRADE